MTISSHRFGKVQPIIPMSLAIQMKLALVKMDFIRSKFRGGCIQNVMKNGQNPSVNLLEKPDSAKKWSVISSLMMKHSSTPSHYHTCLPPPQISLQEQFGGMMDQE